MAKPGELRIIGGAQRRRRVRIADVEGVRPSPDRVRETLFNWLGQTIDGWCVLDLFAGSGALGFEAASRGAAKVVMVERHPKVLQVLRENRALLGQSGVDIRQGDAYAWPAQCRERFDLVLADPPFADTRVPQLLASLSTCIKPSGMVYLETPAAVIPADGWTVYRAGRAGLVHYQLLVPGTTEADPPEEPSRAT